MYDIFSGIWAKVSDRAKQEMIHANKHVIELKKKQKKKQTNKRKLNRIKQKQANDHLSGSKQKLSSESHSSYRASEKDLSQKVASIIPSPLLTPQ